ERILLSAFKYCLRGYPLLFWFWFWIRHYICKVLIIMIHIWQVPEANTNPKVSHYGYVTFVTLHVKTALVRHSFYRIALVFMHRCKDHVTTFLGIRTYYCNGWIVANRGVVWCLRVLGIILRITTFTVELLQCRIHLH